MSKLFVHRLVSFLLLTAVVLASVPLHQIIHKHLSKADISKTVHVKKAEKPCCKPFEALHGNVLTAAKSNFIDQPMNTVYRMNFYSYFIKPLFDLSNKAPPVSLA